MQRAASAHVVSESAMREQIGRGFAMVPPSVACDRRVSCEQTARSLTVGHENPSSQQLAQHILQNQGLLEAGEFCLQHEFGERRVRIQHHRRRLNTAAQPAIQPDTHFAQHRERPSATERIEKAIGIVKRVQLTQILP